MLNEFAVALALPTAWHGRLAFVAHWLALPNRLGWIRRALPALIAAGALIALTLLGAPGPKIPVAGALPVKAALFADTAPVWPVATNTSSFGAVATATKVASVWSVATSEATLLARARATKTALIGTVAATKAAAFWTVAETAPIGPVAAPPEATPVRAVAASAAFWSVAAEAPVGAVATPKVAFVAKLAATGPAAKLATATLPKGRAGRRIAFATPARAAATPRVGPATLVVARPSRAAARAASAGFIVRKMLLTHKINC